VARDPREADAEQDRAVKMLSARAQTEAEAMRALLASQEEAIGAELGARRQTTLPLEYDARERSPYSRPVLRIHIPDSSPRSMESVGQTLTSKQP
jgi:hypothetical protein